MHNQLTHRLSRIEGQIAALKRSAEQSPEDCTENVRQLKTIIQALKKWGEVYLVEQTEECLKSKTSKQKLSTQLEDIIRSIINI